MNMCWNTQCVSLHKNTTCGDENEHQITYLNENDCTSVQFDRFDKPILCTTKCFYLVTENMIKANIAGKHLLKKNMYEG